ncbi:acetyltransferase, including N-acetylase of ribosomal protein [Tepidicaulis marinus]|uniref:Acetyltransferase, including N-acetylase of ribosomal protein n=1 Tax=Tepidicaulis marinus TaxID=1333998 RepID=A0A081BCW1_9HYPH|nr:GNAT family protein [Tepidicaulis marinus]GAK45879.1 acetyltransferase, including N-acetylase of ribosomal protein [Tepidicaulis marinus]
MPDTLPDTLPDSFPPQPKEEYFLELTAGLETPRFLLTPLETHDVPALLTHFQDPRVTEYMDIDPFTRSEEAEDVVGWAENLRAAAQGIRWAIREKAQDGAPGCFLGTCGFNALVYERARRGEVAYDLSPAYWGKGVMAELMPLLIALAAGPLALRRLEAMVTPGNIRSIRLLERHGFEKEGLLRQHAYWKGRFWDQLIFGQVLEGAAIQHDCPAQY